MPPPSPQIEARHGANPFVPIAYGTPFTVTPNATLDVRLVDPAGVNSWSLECVGTDDTSAVLTATRAAPPAFSATIAIPSGAGKAWRFRSRVNNGRNADNRVDPNLTYNVKLAIAAGNGLAVTTTNESFEGSALFGWLKPLNESVRLAGLSAMPVGVGVVTTAAGIGAVVPYGAAFTFARMNAAGTAPEFANPRITNGGLSFVSGQLGLLADPVGALSVGAAGVLVRTDSAKGTAIVGNDVSAVVRAAGGLDLAAGGLGMRFDAATNAFASLASAAAGARVIVDTTTMQVTAAGVGADATKVAVLASGITTSANARGRTLRTRSELKNATVATFNTVATYVVMGTVSLGSCTVGEEIIAQFFANAGSGGGQHRMRMRITNSATPDLAETAGATTRGQNFEGFFDPAGNDHSSGMRHTVTVAESLWVHVIGRTQSASWIINDKEIYAEVYRL